jgi:hypothetical protein
VDRVVKVDAAARRAVAVVPEAGLADEAAVVLADEAVERLAVVAADEATITQAKVRDITYKSPHSSRTFSITSTPDHSAAY